MQITDAIADFLTRIRNANSAKHDTVDIPASNSLIQSFGIVYPSQPCVIVTGRKGLIEKDDTRRTVEHQVAGLNCSRTVSLRRQAVVQIIILFVAVQFTHLHRQGKQGCKGPCRIIVRQRCTEGRITYSNRNVSAHRSFFTATILTAVASGTRLHGNFCVRQNRVVVRTSHQSPARKEDGRHHCILNPLSHTNGALQPGTVTSNIPDRTVRFCRKGFSPDCLINRYDSLPAR